MGAFQKRGSRSKEQQWQRINEEGMSLRGAQATKQFRSKRLLRFARNDTFSSLGCRHHLGEYLFSGMRPESLSFPELLSRYAFCTKGLKQFSLFELCGRCGKLNSLANAGHQRHGCANVAAAPRWRSPGGHHQ